jgi:hypothetical protein
MQNRLNLFSETDIDAALLDISSVPDFNVKAALGRNQQSSQRRPD